MKLPKRPKDPNQLGKLIVSLATDQIKETVPKENKNFHAVELGRLGGLKGGKARSKKLSTEKRSEIAKRAALARWKKINNI